MAALEPERVEAMVVIAGTHRLIGSAKKAHKDAVQQGLPSGWYLDEVRKWHPGGEAQVQQIWRQGAASGWRSSVPPAPEGTTAPGPNPHFALAPSSHDRAGQRAAGTPTRCLLAN